MNSAEEENQATAMARRSLGSDSSYHFRDRTVLRATGDPSRLNQIATCPFAANPASPGFARLLTAEGHLDADLFGLPDEGGWWIDVHAQFAPAVSERLGALPSVDRIGADEHCVWRGLGRVARSESGGNALRRVPLRR